MRFTADERATVDAARAIQARTRKAAKAMRPKPVQPTAEGQRAPRKRDKEHLGFIAQLPCLATLARTGLELYGVHVAHVRHSYPEKGWSNPGLQQKPDDWRTVPLNPAEHALQHSMNEAAYYRALGIYPPTLCAELRSAFPDTEAAKAVLRKHARPS